MWWRAAGVAALLPAACRLKVSRGRPWWSRLQVFSNGCPQPCQTRGFRGLSVGGRCLDFSMAAEAIELNTAGAVLAAARASRQAADREEARLLMLAVDWAGMHSVDSIEDAAMLVGYGDQGMALAGAGAPLVAEFAVTEFAAAIGLSTDAGKVYVGHA